MFWNAEVFTYYDVPVTFIELPLRRLRRY